MGFLCSQQTKAAANRKRPRLQEGILTFLLLSLNPLHVLLFLENEEEVWGGLTSGHFSGPPTGPGRVPRSDAGLPGRRGLSARRPDQAHVSAAPDGPVLGLQSDGVHVVLRAPISLLSFCFFSGRSVPLLSLGLPPSNWRRTTKSERAKSEKREAPCLPLPRPPCLPLFCRLPLLLQWRGADDDDDAAATGQGTVGRCCCGARTGKNSQSGHKAPKAV